MQYVSALCYRIELAVSYQPWYLRLPLTILKSVFTLENNDRTSHASYAVEGQKRQVFGCREFVIAAFILPTSFGSISQ